MEFAAMLRPALVATREISALALLQANAAAVIDYEALLFSLDRGEHRHHGALTASPGLLEA